MKTLFAKMGIPLEECKQNFENMKLNYKNELLQKLKKYSKTFSLNDIFYDSFFKVNFKISIEFWNKL
jgi:hypothetical protein